MELNKRVSDIIKKEISRFYPNINVNIDMNLIDIGFDSLSFIQLIVGLEDKCNVTIPDEKLCISNVMTFSDLCNILIEELADKNNPE